MSLQQRVDPGPNRLVEAPHALQRREQDGIKFGCWFDQIHRSLAVAEEGVLDGTDADHRDDVLVVRRDHRAQATDHPPPWMLDVDGHVLCVALIVRPRTTKAEDVLIRRIWVRQPEVIHRISVGPSHC